MNILIKKIKSFKPGVGARDNSIAVWLRVKFFTGYMTTGYLYSDLDLLLLTQQASIFLSFIRPKNILFLKDAGFPEKYKILKY